MPTFTDSENKQLASPPGDYILQILSFDKGLSTGAKTSGSDKYDVKIGVEKDGKIVSELREFLIDHESCLWKFDVMLKSCNVKIAKGESYTFDKDEAAQKNIRHIEIRGLRGWATIGMRAPQTAGQPAKFNEVVAWITNKEKLPPVAVVEAEDEAENIPF